MMRLKDSQRFFQANTLHYNVRRIGFVGHPPYSGMLNLASAYQKHMNTLAQSLSDRGNTNLFETVQKRLDFLWTYHSLKLTGLYHLSLEDTIFLLQEHRTIEGKSFTEQLKAVNHLNIVDYCRQYAALIRGSRNVVSNKIEQGDHYCLTALGDIASSFVKTMLASHSVSFDTTYGGLHPAGTFYFYDRNEEHEHLYKGHDLLNKCAKEGADDVIMTAALIHGEFAKVHHFDSGFGLVFCKLYMNLALMIEGHVPIVIDSSQKKEYLSVVKHQFEQQDAKPMATFLAACLNNTYKTFVLPDLEKYAKSSEIDVPITFGRQ
jgi:hypothetical protein